MRRPAVVPALAALVALASAARPGQGGAAPLPAAPASLDALAVRDLDGNPFPVDPFRGRVVVVDFWATWCAPCRESFRFFDALQRRDGERGLTVLGLTLEEDPQTILGFLDTVEADFPIVRDPSGAAGTRFAVEAMPTTLVFDRAGRLAARFEGSGGEIHARIEKAVDVLLAGGTLGNSAGVRVAAGLRETGAVRAWRRGYLADPIMSLEGDPLTRLLSEHVHASKEGAAGDGGAAGGGCGCN